MIGCDIQKNPTEEFDLEGKQSLSCMPLGGYTKHVNTLEITANISHKLEN